jgi:hypothetical protein
MTNEKKRTRRNAITPNSIEAQQIRSVARDYFNRNAVACIESISIDSDVPNHNVIQDEKDDISVQNDEESKEIILDTIVICVVDETSEIVDDTLLSNSKCNNCEQDSNSL